MSLFNIRLRMATRLALRKEGKGFMEIQELMSGFTDDLPQVAAGMCGVAIPAEFGAEAIGDGSILKAILDFLKSEQGQALIKMILMLLMGL